MFQVFGRYLSGTALLVLLSFVAGCGYTVRPAGIPAAASAPAISLGGTGILIVNGEKDPSEKAIPSERRSSSGLKANRQEWGRKLTESLAGELARRGAQVRANAKLVLIVGLPDIVFTQDREGARFTVKVLLSSSTGWSKTYEGTARTDRLSEAADADRVAAKALADAIRAMLGDAELQAQLLRK